MWLRDCPSRTSCLSPRLESWVILGSHRVYLHLCNTVHVGNVDGSGWMYAKLLSPALADPWRASITVGRLIWGWTSGLGSQAGRVIPSDRERHRLPLKCSTDSVAIAFCVQGGRPVLRVDSDIFLIQRKTVQITPPSPTHTHTHTANGTASFYVATLYPRWTLDPSKKGVRRGSLWAHLLPVICRQESCENQGLKCQRTQCEPSHTGRDIGSCAVNLPRRPSHSPQTPWQPRRSDTSY